MNPHQALDLALEALREAAERLQLDQRAVDILGPAAPRDVRRRAHRRQQLLTAIGSLKKLQTQINGSDHQGD